MCASERAAEGGRETGTECLIVTGAANLNTLSLEWDLMELSMVEDLLQPLMKLVVQLKVISISILCI